MRKLPLTAVRKICLASLMKDGPPVPNEEVLQLQDGAETLEAKSRDDLAGQLREKYPDAAFARTLHSERDREAEERRERAVNAPAKNFAEHALKQMIEEESRVALVGRSRDGDS